ncbi:MAG TPA: CCC motif membrane protein [Flavobacteriaceae bacterium]|nr:CCC motif membrane protein [Flavobacteriaceae bacterium]
MEQQKLPNSTLILVFGILSIVTCCCYGFIGLILGIVAIVLANKATKLYAENPEAYTGFQNVKTGRILAIIGVVLSAIYLLYVIYMFSTVGYDGIMDRYNEAMEQFSSN